MKILKQFALGCALSTVALSGAYAATDGPIGATSQGDLDITLTVI